MSHAFLIEMNGIAVFDTDAATTIVRDHNMLVRLLASGSSTFPRITLADIEDKTKADGFAKTITICQIMWFCINMLA